MKRFKNKNSWIFLLLLLSGCDALVQKIPLPDPEADFEFIGEGCTAPCQVQVYNKSYFATIFDWDPGTGKLYTEKDPLIYFPDAGDYTVSLVVSNVDGQSATVERHITILENPVAPEPSEWMGRWNVVLPEQTGARVNQSSAPVIDLPNRSAANSPDLTVYAIEGWPTPILTRNSLFDVNQMEGSTLKNGQVGYMAFGFANLGDITTEQRFFVRVTHNGRNIFEFEVQHTVAPGATYFFYDIFMGTLGEGTHTLTVELDPYNAITEENTTNNTYTQEVTVVSQPAYESFEFVENRYLIEYNQNQYKYGSMVYSDPYLQLSQIGNIEVSNQSEETMQLTIDGYTYDLTKENPTIEVNDQTKRLTNNVWVNQSNEEWMLTTTGRAVIKSPMGLSRTSWSLVNGNQIEFVGEMGTYEIVELTNTRLLVMDALSNQILFNPGKLYEEEE